MKCPKCQTPLAAGEIICQSCGYVQRLTTSRPLPVSDAQGSCRVCGNPLGERKICDICGSSIAQLTTRTGGLTCPFCGGDMGDSISCPKCGGVAGGDAADAELGYQCPSCGKEISVEDETCQTCGLRIWLDQNVEISRLDGFSCPACGAGLGEDDETCASCGFQVWLESPEDRKERAGRAIDEAKMRIAEIQDKFGRAPDRAVTYIEAAERVLEDGESDLATRRALVASDIAQTESRQRGILAEARRRAQEKAKSAEESGCSIAGCVELLDLSRQAESRGELKVAIRLALRCKIIAEELVGTSSHVPLGA